MKRKNHSAWLKAYYDKNTFLFNKFGKVGRTKNIHASIWKDGIKDEQTASNYSNSVICKAIQLFVNRPAEVLDLGCGLGGTLHYLSQQLGNEVRYTGITLSQYQAKQAREILSSYLPDRIDIQVGDFHHLPDTWGNKYDVAYALESFVHSDSVACFFEETRRVIKPGGILVLIDTFLNKDLEEIHEKDFAYLSDYQEFWGAGNTLNREGLIRQAALAGYKLLLEENLTPYLAQGRLRDHWIGFFNFLFRPFMRLNVYLQSLRGGHAVQMGFKSGWLSYRYFVFSNTHE